MVVLFKKTWSFYDLDISGDVDLEEDKRQGLFLSREMSNLLFISGNPNMQLRMLPITLEERLVILRYYFTKCGKTLVRLHG